MRKWIDLFKDISSDQPLLEASSASGKLYHFSPMKFIKSVKEHGLDPAFRTSNSPIVEGEKRIYLAGTAAQASEYIHYHDVSEGLLLSVNIETLDINLLGPDDVDLAYLHPKHWHTKDWKASLRLCGQCSYAGIIPASLLFVESYISASTRPENIGVPLGAFDPKWGS